MKIDKLHDFFSGTRPAGNNLRGIREKNNLNSCLAFCFAEMRLVRFFVTRRQRDLLLKRLDSLLIKMFYGRVVLIVIKMSVFLQEVLKSK
ncbi:MAG: hypothetical protein IJU47_06865 [Verrucomicrobia bacterium]|nr:hypothetical protein [Verrucomicrobiota bacterium]